MLQRLAVLGAALLLSACPNGCENNSPTGSTGIEMSDGRPAGVPGWSPYVGVHTFGPDGLLAPHVLNLMESGAMRGLRADMGPSSGGSDFARWAIANGLEDVVGIFPNEFLRGSGAWDALRSEILANPGVDYWEIGNEIDVFTTMSVSEYMPIFLDLHRRAREEFPEKAVIAQAPIGGGDGAKYVEQMLDQGLLELARRGELPVLSLHFYSTGSTYIYTMKRQIQRLPGTTEIWVTETGIDDPGRHLEHVQTQYPRLRREWRATRIYWYVFAECTGFSLVSGLPGACPATPSYSPLYQALTGKRAP
ncbi:MAG TPA: hypothetical protein VD862_02795 [Candidatus Paceibacterota bacterium]|nr:hypothetical protein [Candidatus Paceibacterota bacterium]